MAANTDMGKRKFFEDASTVKQPKLNGIVLANFLDVLQAKELPAPYPSDVGITITQWPRRLVANHASIPMAKDARSTHITLKITGNNTPATRLQAMAIYGESAPEPVQAIWTKVSMQEYNCSGISIQKTSVVVHIFFDASSTAEDKTVRWTARSVAIPFIVTPKADAGSANEARLLLATIRDNPPRDFLCKAIVEYYRSCWGEPYKQPNMLRKLTEEEVLALLSRFPAKIPPEKEFMKLWKRVAQFQRLFLESECTKIKELWCKGFIQVNCKGALEARCLHYEPGCFQLRLVNSYFSPQALSSTRQEAGPLAWAVALDCPTNDGSTWDHDYFTQGQLKSHICTAIMKNNSLKLFMYPNGKLSPKEDIFEDCRRPDPEDPFCEYDKSVLTTSTNFNQQVENICSEPMEDMGNLMETLQPVAQQPSQPASPMFPLVFPSATPSESLSTQHLSTCSSSSPLELTNGDIPYNQQLSSSLAQQNVQPPTHTQTHSTITQPEQEIENWLKNLHLGQYYTNLMDEGFDSWPRVKSITTEDLESMGIIKKGHVRQLMQCIKQLP